MQHLWTWSGMYFGYRDGNDLWNHHGKHVGRFVNDDVFGPDGRYLGELVGERLIRHQDTTIHHAPRFAPFAPRVGNVPYTNYVGYVMSAGHEDFPGPDKF